MVLSLSFLLEQTPLVHSSLQHYSPGARLQLKLLESALSSLLQCQTALHHYHQLGKDSETAESGQQDKGEGEEEEGRKCEDKPQSDSEDSLITLLLTRLLAILKQLVAIAMKKRYVLNHGSRRV